MKVSVLSYSFRGLLGTGQMDVFGYLETCKYRYGLQAADIWNGFLPSTDEGYLRRVKESLDERELELADLCVDRAHVWDDDPAVREANYRNALAHLRAAEILGARFVRIDAGSRRETWSDEEFEHIVRRYREYAQWAWDHGFKMGAENHWGPEKHWSNLKKLYEAVDHPGFGISCHIGGWAGTDEEKAEADRLVAPWVCHTHFPWNITEGPLEERMANLRDAGYQGYYSVEHHKGRDEYGEVAVQLARVRAVLARWASSPPSPPQDAGA
ncbi:MAG TPA: TIM barrel protein [Chloroflexota bacterium]|nr:TIM barrel protein [Chloroflexota bacterium]